MLSQVFLPRLEVGFVPPVGQDFAGCHGPDDPTPGNRMAEIGSDVSTPVCSAGI